MGSNDIPPPHVPNHVVPTCNTLLQIGGSLWTVCYILLWRQSIKTRSYGMPLFALSFNFAWEAIYAPFVAEALLERVVFGIWLLLDCGMVYGALKYGRKEWDHAPFVKKNLGMVILGLTVYCAAGHWAFAKWWIDSEIGKREGKFYRGVVGPDISELAFWSAALSQAYLSAASLGQLLIRQHSGGVSWGVWATRAFGSLTGMYMNYGWAWYFWREAHEYFMSPFGIFLWGTGFVCDLIYPLVLYEVQRTEKVLPDGSRVRGGDSSLEKVQKTA